MPNELIIYCDESDTKGKYFSNFYGGSIIKSCHLGQVVQALSDKKHSLNLHNEVKWQRVTKNYCQKYIELLDLFFELISDNLVKMRIMFTQNRHIAQNLSDYNKENEYFLLYYQFIKHSFGLKYYSAPDNQPTHLRIYLDKLPDKKEKSKEFKKYLQSLTSNTDFKKNNLWITEENIAEIDSRDHVILQLTDIVLGAMQFRLNDLHKEKPANQHRRGKRTIAKEKLYKYINQRIRQIYPGFNIGCSTSMQGDPSNNWHHPYRHWLFVPKEFEVDNSLAKSKK